jgi:hypothetical protein
VLALGLSSVAGRASTATIISNFMAAGDFTWKCPQNVNSVQVECWGGGGGGGGTYNNNTLGSGGGGGSYVKYTASVTPGATYNLHVDAGGTAGAASSPGTGGNGGPSYFGNTTVGNPTGASVLANGGTGGADGGSASGTSGVGNYKFTTGGGGAGGSLNGNVPVSGTANSIEYTGTTGANAATVAGTSNTTGAGGAGAGSSGSAGGGAGGVAITGTSSTSGNNGTQPGGGGSGSLTAQTVKAGGIGGAGEVQLTYTGTPYYSQGNLDPTQIASWSNKRDGTGGSPPDFLSGDTFVIQNGHNMTNTAAWTIAGTGNKIEIENGGTLTANYIVATTTFQVDNGGTYIHNATGSGTAGSSGDFPGSTTISLGTSSTVQFAAWGVASQNPPKIPAVSYGTLTLNIGTAWGGSLNMSGTLTNIDGNLTVQATGGQEFRLSASTTYNLVIGGDLSIQGGTLSGASSTMGSGSTITLYGNYNQSGGTLTCNSGSSNVWFTFDNASGPTSVGFTQSGGTFTADRYNFTVGTGKTLTLNSSFNTGTTSSRQFAVNGTLNCGANHVIGSAAFALSSCATLGIGDGNGITSSGASGNIQVTGVRTFDPGANYTYNGTGIQAAGNGLTTVNNLTIANTAAAVQLSGNVTVNGTLTVNSGATLDLNSHSVTTPSAPSLNGVLIMEVNKTGANTFTGAKLIQTSGNVNYGGTLTVTATGNTLANGDSVPLFVTSGNYNGWFSSVAVPTLASGHSWDTNKLATTGVLDLYAFTTTALALSTPVNSNAVISVAKLQNHATTARGTPCVAMVTTPANGSASVSGGILTYSPNPGFAGSDSFNCIFQDGHGWQMMTVSVTVGSGTSQSPNVLSASIVGSNFVVNFAGVPGTTYTVETNSAANGPGWKKLGNITATSTGAMQVIDPLGNGSLFYRTVYPSY